jgi:hypothetical protein
MGSPTGLAVFRSQLLPSDLLEHLLNGPVQVGNFDGQFL